MVVNNMIHMMINIIIHNMIHIIINNVYKYYDNYCCYSSSFAHSATPGRKVEMLGWNQEGIIIDILPLARGIQCFERRLLRSLL